MIIYIDSNFCCHLQNDGTMQAIETDIFDEKCISYIEGYRFVPAGQSWIRNDGEIFTGEMICPWVDYNILLAAQTQYETDNIQMQDMQTALEILGVTE